MMTSTQVIKILTDHPTNLLGWVCDNNMFVDFQKYAVRYDHTNELMYLKPISNDQHSKNYVDPSTGLKLFRAEILPYDVIQDAVVSLDDEQWLAF